MRSSIHVSRWQNTFSVVSNRPRVFLEHPSVPCEFQHQVGVVADDLTGVGHLLFGIAPYRLPGVIRQPACRAVKAVPRVGRFDVHLDPPVRLHFRMGDLRVVVLCQKRIHHRCRLHGLNASLTLYCTMRRKKGQAVPHKNRLPLSCVRQKRNAPVLAPESVAQKPGIYYAAAIAGGRSCGRRFAPASSEAIWLARRIAAARASEGAAESATSQTPPRGSRG